MTNRESGLDPIHNMLHHGQHPFPPEIEELIRRLHAIKPRVVDALGREACDWARGEHLEQARFKLEGLLDECCS